MSGCEASLENASTMPGLVVWSSSTISSTCLPSTPPALLTASSASLAPLIGIAAGFGGRPGDRRAHADLDGGALRPARCR